MQVTFAPSTPAPHRRPRRAAWAASLLTGAALATLAQATFLLRPARAERPPHEARLVVPTQGRDHSAFRFDTEVFGWNSDFTEVAGVCMEVVRGPLGRHRGETYLLVYRLGETVAKHNITCHAITHADLPHNPVPLLDAKDYLWSIENSYQAMWPKRPRRSYRRGDVQVDALWAAMPSNSTGASCTPWVSLRMRMGKQERFMPYRPLDVTARCDLLALTNVRTYWGRPDIAASMVRFDFPGRPANEESARFVVSAAWKMGRTPTVRLKVPAWARADPRVRALQRALAQSGRVVVEPFEQGGVRGELVANARGRREWLPAAMRALRQADVPLEAFAATDAGPPISLPAAPAAVASSPPAASAPALPNGKAAAGSRALQRPSARFGTRSDASDDAMTALMSSPPSGGEAGMVAEITTQHDPIEEAFEERDEGAESSASPPLHATVPGAVAGGLAPPAEAAARQSERPSARVSGEAGGATDAASAAAPAGGAPSAFGPSGGRLLAADTIEIVLHVAALGWPARQAPGAAGEPAPAPARATAPSSDMSAAGEASPADELSGRRPTTPTRTPSATAPDSDGSRYLRDWSPAQR